jgi:hypothetical protein
LLRRHLRLQPRQPSRRLPASHARTKTTRTTGPALDGSRVGGEIAVATLLLVGGAYVGGRIGYEAALDCPREYEGCGDDALLHGGLPGGAIGGVIGATAGVFVIGNLGDETGSLWATLGGSGGGALFATAAILWSSDGGNNQIGTGSVLLLLAAPIAGATIGFNLTRRYDEEPQPRAWAPVANVSHGTASFGVVGQF